MRDSNGGRRRSLFSFLSPASSALSDNCRSHVGIRFQNLAQSGNLEIVARIWHGVPVPRARFFWKSKNLAQKINLARGSPQSGNNLATIWQRSGNKKMEKTHLAQFKKPPSVCVNLSSGGEGRFQYYQCKTALPYYFLTIVLFVIMTSKYHYT